MTTTSTYVNGGSVHIDGCSKWQYKSCNMRRNLARIFGTLHGDGKGRRTAGASKCCSLSRNDIPHEFEGIGSGDEDQHASVCHKDMDKHACHDSEAEVGNVAKSIP